MLIPALILLPVVAGLAAFALRRDAVRRALLVSTAAAHAALTARAFVVPSSPAWNGWLALDPLGLYFLGITSALFLAASVYAVGYLRREETGKRRDMEERVFFSNAPEAVFTGCLLLFLAAMTLVTVSQRFGILWVAIEATTLASAPLIYFHRHHRSLEAAWKYLMVCSVGIAMALLGTFCLAVAVGPAPDVPLLLPDLIARGAQLNKTWLHVSFICLLVGYGTKMGLAPLHTWLPDAHSEAPSLVSALLSGALLNCAFLGLLRGFQVLHAAGEGPFAQGLLGIFGILSIGVAAAYILAQSDYKRLLAYSSVEHMGLLALGVGLGGGGIAGALLQALNHSFTKGAMFLLSGNILRIYRTKSIAGVHGVWKRLPASGLLWTAGFLALVGMPPFGSFVSKLAILRAAFDGGRARLGLVCVGLLALIFIGMAGKVFQMVQGRSEEDPGAPGPAAPEPVASILPPALLLLAVAVVGLWVPAGMERLLDGCVASLGGSR